MLSITLSLIMIRDVYTLKSKFITKKYSYIFSNIFDKCHTKNNVTYTDIIKNL